MNISSFVNNFYSSCLHLEIGGTTLKNFVVISSLHHNVGNKHLTSLEDFFLMVKC